MAKIFIFRPILAWVIAIFIAIAGILAVPSMPISQYPQVAPPQISISTYYTGASPEEMYQGVASPIEEELNGIEGIEYFESTSDASGSISITATFTPETDPAKATIDVQNAVSRVEPRLPAAVTQTGITVEQASSGFLMMVALTSTDGTMSEIELGDYINRNVLGELRRTDGVGKAQLFASPVSMRIWVDPDKMTGLNLTPGEINAAIRAQNAQVGGGMIGADPNPIDTAITATVLVKGQLTDLKDFENIILRANADGSNVRLKDVARIELGAQSYNFGSRLNGQPSAAIAIQLSSSGNALATANQIKAKMENLAQIFPSGVVYSIPYDTSPFVEKSITKVIHTLLEAVALVFVVMFIFMQNFRYTIIPIIVVPIALSGTLAVLWVAGFSINVMTMFAMVLAIGILVDDAIVVVENVERLMVSEHLSPQAATIKAMQQITGAIVGISLVLSAVFVPMAFFAGSTGIIYRQFALTMVISILFSALLALTLTPALCATFLKPIPEGHNHSEKKGFFGAFNRSFDAITRKYGALLGGLTRRSGLMMLVYLAITVATGWGFTQLPSSFIPNEDQGFVIVDLQTPPSASGNRTLAAITQAEAYFQSQPEVDSIVAVKGFSFSGTGTNAALMFVTFKDWTERSRSADDIANGANRALFSMKDGQAFALSPPAIMGLGGTGGFSFRLQDRGGLGQQALSEASAQLIRDAAASGLVVAMRAEGMPPAAQVVLTIDREKANTFGVSFADINSVMSTYFASTYVNDFPNGGRLNRVVVQADQMARLDAEDLLKLTVRNAQGGMVPFSTFATVAWQQGPSQVIGYNGYAAVRLSGSAAPGFSTGEAMAKLEELAAKLPEGFGYEWTGSSLEEIKAGNQEYMLYGLAIMFVFLLLAGLYESWSIPLSVMLIVPMGILGCVVALILREMPNDLYFKVGLITIIGLSAKNAILIVEFAKELVEEGKGVMEASIESAKLRFRPILMTSLAFTFGVLPMMTASGASAASQQALGTGVVGGMIAATFFAPLFVPIFFTFIMRFAPWAKKHVKSNS